MTEACSIEGWREKTGDVDIIVGHCFCGCDDPRCSGGYLAGMALPAKSTSQGGMDTIKGRFRLNAKQWEEFKINIPNGCWPNIAAINDKFFLVYIDKDSKVTHAPLPAAEPVED